VKRGGKLWEGNSTSGVRGIEEEKTATFEDDYKKGKLEVRGLVLYVFARIRLILGLRKRSS